MQRAWPDRERLDIADMGDPETLVADGFDIFRSRIDVGHIFAGLHHMRAGIAADRAGADNRNFLVRHHVFSRISFGSDPSTADGPASPFPIPSQFSYMSGIRQERERDD